MVGECVSLDLCIYGQHLPQKRLAVNFTHKNDNNEYLTANRDQSSLSKSGINYILIKNAFFFFLNFKTVFTCMQNNLNVTDCSHA